MPRPHTSPEAVKGKVMTDIPELPTSKRLVLWIKSREVKPKYRGISQEAWSFVGCILGYGSTYSWAWCKQNGIDPEMKVRPIR